MAKTQVKDICLICNKKLFEGKAVFITVVNLTKTGPGYVPSFQVPEGKLRIQIKSTSKPRGCIHIECINNFFELQKETEVFFKKKKMKNNSRLKNIIN